VNLRDAMGGEITRLVPQAWSKLADERIEKQIEGARSDVLAGLQKYSEDIRRIVDGELADEMSRRTVNTLFEASLGRAENRIEESAKRVRDLLGRTSKEMQERVDEAVDLALLASAQTVPPIRGSGGARALLTGSSTAQMMLQTTRSVVVWTSPIRRSRHWRKR
jgi:hypothetical protein